MTTQTALSPDPDGVIEMAFTGSGETVALTGPETSVPWRFTTADAGIRMKYGEPGVSAAAGTTLIAGAAEVFVIPAGKVVAFAGTGTVELTRMLSVS